MNVPSHHVSRQLAGAFVNVNDAFFRGYLKEGGKGNEIAMIPFIIDAMHGNRPLTLAVSNHAFKWCATDVRRPGLSGTCVEIVKTGIIGKKVWVDSAN